MTNSGLPPVAFMSQSVSSTTFGTDPSREPYLGALHRRQGNVGEMPGAAELVDQVEESLLLEAADQHRDPVIVEAEPQVPEVLEAVRVEKLEVVDHQHHAVLLAVRGRQFLELLGDGLEHPVLGFLGHPDLPRFVRGRELGLRIHPQVVKHGLDQRLRPCAQRRRLKCQDGRAFELGHELELVHQSALADPSLARDADHVPLSLLTRLQHGIEQFERLVPADEARGHQVLGQFDGGRLPRVRPHKGLDHGSRVARTAVRLLVNQRQQHRFKLRRDVLVEFARRLELGVVLPLQPGTDVLLARRSATGHYLVEHHSERIQVRTCIGIRALEHLGRHVSERAPWLRRFSQAYLLREPEVEDLDLGAVFALLDQDVVRLDVAVNQALHVDAVQRMQRLHGQLLQFRSVTLLETGVYRLALRVLHREVRTMVFARAIVERFDYAGVGKPGKVVKLAT
jgi:hypothetical protein